LGHEVRNKRALPRATWASKIFEVEALGSDAAEDDHALVEIAE
jgi:hypothetical protein